MGPNSETLLGLAKTAALGGNASEAYAYAARVLESDPHSVEAWLLKAEGAGWMSTLADIRLNEMLVGFRAAMTFASEADLPEVRARSVAAIQDVGAAIANTSIQHVCDFPMLETWQEHIGRCFLVLDTYEYALTLTPGDRMLLEGCLQIAASLIQGVRYTMVNGAVDVLRLTPAAQTELQGRINAWSAAIRAQDPSFLTPTPQAQSNCFVVTATMGQEASFPVQYLRAFRDDHLVNFGLGSAFTDWYYAHGPGLADRIRTQRWRRVAAFVMVVIPGMALAACITAARRAWASIRSQFQ